MASEYRPVRCSATPQAEIAPVQEVSEVGLAFCASGSGWAVEMIQSALPAVSPWLASKSTLYGVAAATAGAGLPASVSAPAEPTAPSSTAMTARIRRFPVPDRCIV